MSNCMFGLFLLILLLFDPASPDGPLPDFSYLKFRGFRHLSKETGVKARTKPEVRVTPRPFEMSQLINGGDILKNSKRCIGAQSPSRANGGQ